MFNNKGMKSFPAINPSFLIFLMLISGICYGQNLLPANEQLIFSFDTKNGKHVELSKDQANSYIVYRFGTADKIEFEFPAKSKESWSKFRYSFYLRGGGIQNEGMDLNYIHFTNEGFKYTIYDTYFAKGQESGVGIMVTNLKTNKTTDVKGIHQSRKGTLINFRENGLLEIVDDAEN